MFMCTSTARAHAENNVVNASDEAIKIVKFPLPSPKRCLLFIALSLPTTPKSIWWGRILMKLQLQPKTPLPFDHAVLCCKVKGDEVSALFLCFPNARSEFATSSQRHRRALTVASIQRHKEVEKTLREPTKLLFSFQKSRPEKRRNKKKVSCIFVTFLVFSFLIQRVILVFCLV